MTQTNTVRKPAARKPRKKVKRKLHKGRVAMALSILAVIVIAIMALLSRCSGDAGHIFREGGDFRKPVPTALEAGRRDAMKVMQTAPGSMERDGALLFIKSREYRLRSAGYGHAADDYINAANDYLLTHGLIKSR